MPGPVLRPATGTIADAGWRSYRGPLHNIPGTARTAAEIRTTGSSLPEGVNHGYVHFQSGPTGAGLQLGGSGRAKQPDGVPETSRGCPGTGLTGWGCARSFRTTNRPDDGGPKHPGVLHVSRSRTRGRPGGSGMVLVRAYKLNFTIRVCPLHPEGNSGGLPVVVPSARDSRRLVPARRFPESRTSRWWY